MLDCLRLLGFWRLEFRRLIDIVNFNFLVLNIDLWPDWVFEPWHVPFKLLLLLVADRRQVNIPHVLRVFQLFVSQLNFLLWVVSVHLPCLLHLNNRLVIILWLIINLVHLCCFRYLLIVLLSPFFILFLELINFIEVDRLVEFLNLFDYFGLSLLYLLLLKLKLSIKFDEERGLDPYRFGHQPRSLLLLTSSDPKLCLLPMVLLHLIHL